MNDQIAAGAFMWVMGSMMYLIPAMIITVQLLSPRRQRVGRQGTGYREQPVARSL
jgi:hypothetical protein